MSSLTIDLRVTDTQHWKDGSSLLTHRKQSARISNSMLLFGATNNDGYERGM